MKKISIISILAFSTLSASSLSSDEITSMISKIKEERVGIALSKLNNTENPFIIIKKKKKEVAQSSEKKATAVIQPEIVYTLHAILNHAAFINKKWYKKGDKLGKYHIVTIGKKGVKISSKLVTKTLTMKKRKNKFIQLNKGKK